MVCSGMCSHSALEEIASFLLCFIFPLLLLSYMFSSASNNTKCLQIRLTASNLNIERANKFHLFFMGNFELFVVFLAQELF